MQDAWMDLAFDEAEKALQRGEVPVGAVIVVDGQVISRAHNLVETLQDPAAHAEMLAISAAAGALASWRLNEASIYVTLEPCPMCMGAIHLSRLSSLTYAAGDPRLGACGSAVDLSKLAAMRKPVTVHADTSVERSRALLQKFFAQLRSRNAAQKKPGQ